MAQSLFDSYNSMVSTSNMDEFCRTAVAWNNQQCSLVALRPGGCGVSRVVLMMCYSCTRWVEEDQPDYINTHSTG